MVRKILQAVSPSADKVEVRRIGEANNEMDPVGLVYPSDKSIAAVVFPIAESLKQVCTAALNVIPVITIECLIAFSLIMDLSRIHA